MTLPDAATQTDILLSHTMKNTEHQEAPDFGLDGEMIQKLQSFVGSIPVSRPIPQYITDLCENLRKMTNRLSLIPVRARRAHPHPNRDNDRVRGERLFRLHPENPAHPSPRIPRYFLRTDG